jgi:hypothetical protein
MSKVSHEAMIFGTSARSAASSESAAAREIVMNAKPVINPTASPMTRNPRMITPPFAAFPDIKLGEQLAAHHTRPSAIPSTLALSEPITAL